ncbi:MAG: hypothetical protein ACHP7N_05355 [Caulobacterales bacterium]
MAGSSVLVAPALPRPRIGVPTKLFYGLGSIAFGVKDNGFQTFLGLFFAGNGFAAKVVSGAGLFIAGLLLAWANFPAHAAPGHVPQPILRHLVLTYVPTYGGLYAVAVLFLAAYQISRAKHEENLKTLADALAIEETVQEAQGTIL